MTVSMTMEPEGNWVKKLSKERFNLSSLKFAISIDNIPKGMLNLLAENFVKSAISAFNGKTSTPLHSLLKKDNDKWLTKLQKLEFGPSVYMSFSTDKGNGFADLGAHFKNAGITWKQLKQLKHSEKIDEALMTVFNIDGKSQLPAELIEDLKLQMFIAMIYNKQGNTYVSKVETENRQLLINNIPFNFSKLYSKLKKTDKSTEEVSGDTLEGIDNNKTEDLEVEK